jgi:hypothetical protein
MTTGISLHAVRHRHLHVHQDKIRQVLFRQSEAGSAVPCFKIRIVRPEKASHEHPDGGGIIDKKDR